MGRLVERPGGRQSYSWQADWGTYDYRVVYPNTGPSEWLAIYELEVISWRRGSPDPFRIQVYRHDAMATDDKVLAEYDLEKDVYRGKLNASHKQKIVEYAHRLAKYVEEEPVPTPEGSPKKVTLPRSWVRLEDVAEPSWGWW